MKTTVIILIATFLIACGRGDGENSPLIELQSQRDSLVTVYDEVGEQISLLEQRIAELDTTIQTRRMLVSTQKIERQKFEHFFEVHGVVEAKKNAIINAEVPGTIKQIMVNEGQHVRKGQSLVLLDMEVIRKNIEEVETSYDLAKMVYERQENLWKQQIGSEMQYLEAKNRKEALEHKLSTLQAQLKKSVITAPFAGTIDEIFPKVGEMAAPQLPLLRLINLENAYIVSDISENYVSKVRKGNYARVNFSSLDNTWLDAKVSRVGQYINPNNRTFKIRIELDNYDNKMLKPNLLSIIRIRDFEQDSAIVVPSKFIQQDAYGNNYMFIVENGSIAKKVGVVTGISYEGKTLIKSGLKGDEYIVLEGSRSIKDGEILEIKK